MHGQRINKNTRQIVFSVTTNSILNLGAWSLELIYYHSSCPAQLSLGRMLWGIDQRLKMSYSLPWMSAFQPRPRSQETLDCAGDRQGTDVPQLIVGYCFNSLRQHLGPLCLGRQKAALGMLIWWEQTRCYQLPHYNISATSLFFLVARESGSAGRAWWATEAESETRMLTPSQQHRPSLPPTGLLLSPRCLRWGAHLVVSAAIRKERFITSTACLIWRYRGSLSPNCKHLIRTQRPGWEFVTDYRKLWTKPMKRGLAAAIVHYILYLSILSRLWNLPRKEGKTPLCLLGLILEDMGIRTVLE